MSRSSRTTRSISNPIYGSITDCRHEDSMNAAPLAPYRVSAYNTAHDSENKIHDDATARRFGFGGGLGPGGGVYGYMTHMPVARWGRASLERGPGRWRLLQ